MNLRRHGISKPFDRDICSIVVPSSLIGTLMGVLLNRHTPDAVIVSLLSLVLTALSVKMFWEAYRSRCEELEVVRESPANYGSTEGGTSIEVRDEAALAGRTGKENGAHGGEEVANVDLDAGAIQVASDSWSESCGKMMKARAGTVAAGMLAVVILSGVTRY